MITGQEMCVCVITGQAGQGMSVYDYGTRDVFV